MSLACCFPVIECVYCLACARWAWKRLHHTGSHDSETWGPASAVEFEPVPRLCRYILAVYEDDLDHPLWSPPGGYGINTSRVVCRKNYVETRGRAPPYLIYLDDVNADIVVAIRGLNLVKESDYALLLDNSPGKKTIDGGYVHNGLLKAAAWILDAEGELLKKYLGDYPHYSLTFSGHSLGSGVAALMAILVAQHTDKLGNVEMKRVRCYAMAPARCMSLNLAVRYANVINSVVLQDDFLPRTSTPLEDIFKCIFCLPCILCIRCMKDTCIPEETKIRDPRRLYAPGRLYHIVERKPFRCGKFPPVVKTAVPVDGRFEQIVLSCNATADHAIVWIEREARKALEEMMREEEVLMMEVPQRQKIERQEILKKEHGKEHKAALSRAVTLSVPDAYLPSAYGTFDDGSSGAGDVSSSRRTKKESWAELIDRLFVKDEHGHMVVRGGNQ